VDFSNVNLWAAAIAIVLSALGAYITANRVSKSRASQAALEDQAKALENQQTALETVRLSYVALQQTYLIDNERLNVKVDRLQNDKDALLNIQVTDKAECLRQIIALQVRSAELETQLTVLLKKMPDNTMVRQVEIVAAKVTLPVHIDANTGPIDVKVQNPLPVPVVIKGPLPVPMTAAQVAQAEAEEEAKKE
jgi:hypothetical protein